MFQLCGHLRILGSLQSWACLLLMVVLLTEANALHLRSQRKLSSAAFKVSFANYLRDPTPAGAYLDSQFEDYAAARQSVCGSFTKRNKVAVIYMCFERESVIRESFAALLKSDGLENFDLIVSQDGGSNYTVEVPPNALYVRHQLNLCTGLHHYWVKRFAFDIMGYDALIVVEEDNVVHPQALQMLAKTIELSVSDPSIGLVSITDMDNSLLIDTARYSSAVIPTEVAQGHLWVYAIHKSRYAAVHDHLHSYYEVIKGYDYRTKAEPPLSDAIVALRSSKGMPIDAPLSQDAYFVASLTKEGYSRRFTTMVRLFEPVGFQGLHFQEDPSTFYGVYGKGMFEGRIEGEPYDVSKRPEEMARLVSGCRERLNKLYQQILHREVDERTATASASRLITGKLNAVELVRNMRMAFERRHRLAVKHAATHLAA